MKSIIQFFIWRITYRKETTIKFFIMLFALLFLACNKCSGQTALQDSVKISRMDLMHFAENKMLLENCEQNELILINQQKVCNETLTSANKAIDLQKSLIDLHKTKISQLETKVDTLEELNQKEISRKKSWRSISIMLATATTVQSLILILEK